ncbi:MAG: hypothetical protein AAF067_01400 [Pseudomonadota bacterium]
MIQTLRSAALPVLPVLVALWGMAILPAVPATATMTVELCNAEGEVRSVNIPLEQEGGDGENCAQPCHACLSRQKPTSKQARV